MKLLSLCIPTNGISEWVFPVLDSIYNQKVDDSLFEVIVTDNGNNEQFSEEMQTYARKHENLIYKKTTAYLFYNQLEALKLADGEYFKFLNHRATLNDGSLQRLIDLIKKYYDTKPVIYFSNGNLEKEIYNLDSFDLFVKTLRKYCSWTTGVGIWKEQYKAIPAGTKIDSISPHSYILFSQRERNDYIIDNIPFCSQIETDHSKKGNYDVFKAFGVEEPSIILNLYIDNSISSETLKYVLNDYKKFLSELYTDFVILKKKCSYDLSGFNNSMDIFYSKREIKTRAFFLFLKYLLFLPVCFSKKIIKALFFKKSEEN
jgi:hypothetical protein